MPDEHHLDHDEDDGCTGCGDCSGCVELAAPTHDALLNDPRLQGTWTAGWCWSQVGGLCAGCDADLDEAELEIGLCRSCHERLLATNRGRL